MGPSLFEPETRCTKAHYTFQDNGHIEVHNTGVGVSDGKPVSVTGDAYRPNDAEQGKLKVKFFISPYNDYDVIHTDYKTFSLVYSCHNYLGVAHMEMAWIMSRNRTLDANIVKMLMMNSLHTVSMFRSSKLL